MTNLELQKTEGTKMSSLLNEYKGFLLLLDTLRNINQIKM